MEFSLSICTKIGFGGYNTLYTSCGAFPIVAIVVLPVAARPCR